MLIPIDQIYGWLGISQTFTADDTFIIGIVTASADRLFADFLGYSPASATRTEYYPDRINLLQRDQFIDGWERAGNTNKVVPIDRYRSEKRALLLRHVPVTSIVSVYENPEAWLSDPPDFGTQWLLTAGSDYALDMQSGNSSEDGFSVTGMLIRNTGPWCVAERCVQVTYTAGFSVAQMQAGLEGGYGTLQHAYLMQVQAMYNTVKIHRMDATKIGSQPGLLASESIGDWSASYDMATAAKLYGMQNRLVPAVANMLENLANWSRFF